MQKAFVRFRFARTIRGIAHDSLAYKTKGRPADPGALKR
jgi:hypothetical protein